MEFTIHKQYCSNYVFFLLDHIIALTSEAFPLACRELLIKMMKTQLGKCGKISILSSRLASLQPWVWTDLNQSPLAYQFCSSQISTLSLLPQSSSSLICIHFVLACWASPLGNHWYFAFQIQASITLPRWNIYSPNISPEYGGNYKYWVLRAKRFQVTFNPYDNLGK